MQQVVERNFVGVDRSRLATHAGDDAFGGCRLRRVDASDRGAEIVIAEPLDPYRRAEQQAEIVERERLYAVEPRSDRETVVVETQWQHAVLLEPIGRQRS